MLLALVVHQLTSLRDVGRSPVETTRRSPVRPELLLGRGNAALTLDAQALDPGAAAALATGRSEGVRAWLGATRLRDLNHDAPEAAELESPGLERGLASLELEPMRAHVRTGPRSGPAGSRLGWAWGSPSIGVPFGERGRRFGSLVIATASGVAGHGWSRRVRRPGARCR